MAMLLKAIEEIKALPQDIDQGSRGSSSHHSRNKHKKEKKKEKAKERGKARKESRGKSRGKSRQRRRRRSPSSSESRSSRSRSSSRSGSRRRSNSRRGQKFLTWKSEGSNRRVDPRHIVRIEAQKFQKKGSIQAFAASHPGALTGYFLAGVYARMLKGSIIQETKELRNASVMAWVAQSGLNEVRDVREVATLACAMDAVNRRDLQHCMDILSMRILSIQAAKKKGGSWEKAVALELVPESGGSLLTGGMAALTG
jgi:hypothetical protein